MFRFGSITLETNSILNRILPLISNKFSTSIAGSVTSTQRKIESKRQQSLVGGGPKRIEQQHAKV